MTTTTVQNLVPEQQKGAYTGSTSNKNMATRHDALVLFEEAKKRLLNVNVWQDISRGGAEFKLADQTGELLYSKVPQIGNFIRIHLPVPPDKKGDGYDWVRIEEFETSKDLLKDEELFGFRVRPVEKPGENKGESAHFYTTEATSSFLVMRKGSMVSAIERGRNERPNAVGTVLNKLRNVLVALGAMLGLAKPQWKKLMNGILDPPKL